MKKALVFIAILALFACQKQTVTNGERAAALISQAAEDTGNQRFDSAMEKALEALDLSQGDNLMTTRALVSIIGIDIMTSRDDDAWEKALQAEAIARENGYRNELAGILIAKAKLCSYAEISPETGRNDEGLSYATEALSLAQEVDDVEKQCEACFVIGSLYINKNRWSDPIDQEIYRIAGEYLDKGLALADTYDLTRLRRNGLMFRSRWYQQGNRNEEAIAYFTQVLKGLKETDYLTAASLNDRLVRLYTRMDDADMALEAHENYVYSMQKYLEQRSNEALQEMETRYEVARKEREIERNRFRTGILVLALLLAAAVIVIISGHLRRSRRRNEELQRINDSKEQLIELLANDLRNPASELAAELGQLSESAAVLSPDEIRRHCEALASGARSINSDVATYVGDILIERSRRIADIGLSKREIQIIRLSAEGLTAAEIAERVFLSVHTVNTHRQRIYAKMDVKNVSDMLRKAKDLGII